MQMISHDGRRCLKRAAVSLAMLALLLLRLAPLHCAQDESEGVFDRLVFKRGVFEGFIESIGKDGSLHVRERKSGKVLTGEITKLKHIRFNQNAKLPYYALKMGYIFRLTDGTRLTGNLVGWNGKWAEVETEYAGRIRIKVGSIRYVYTSYAGNVTHLWNLPGDNRIILARGEPIVCEKIEFLIDGKDRKIRYTKDGSSVTISDIGVRGVVFARKSAVENVRSASGWYCLVSMPNFDRLPGVVDKMENGRLHITTRNMGLVKVKRGLIEYAVFAERPLRRRGHLLVCCHLINSVIEYDLEMNEVWEYKPASQPYHATRLENGNVLIAVAARGVVLEVSPEKEVVWSVGGLHHPSCAVRLPNGNTLIAELTDLSKENCMGYVAEVTPDGIITRYFRNQCKPAYVEPLPNGNLLVCDKAMGHNRVFEGNRKGEIIREWKINEPNCARTLPDGRFIALDESGSRAIFVYDGSNPKTPAKAIRTAWLRPPRFDISAAGNIIYYSSRDRIPAILVITPEGKAVYSRYLPSTLVNPYHFEID